MEWSKYQTPLNPGTRPCKMIQPTISTAFRAIRQSGRTVRYAYTFIRESPPGTSFKLLHRHDYDLAWIPASFKVISRNNGYMSGTVKSEEELGFLLENHKRATYTSFNTWSEHKKDKIKRRLLWQVEDYADDVPVCVGKRAILAWQSIKDLQLRNSLQNMCI